MTRALVWKELREHWAVWLSLAIVAAGGAAGLFGLLSPDRNRDDTITGVLWFAAWGYGLVCGALLLAGENEEGTQGFLDVLSAARRRLWGVKACTGLFLLLAQVAALGAVGLFFLARGGLPVRAVPCMAGLLVCGGIGYAWGLFCGSFAKSVLTAVGWGVLLQIVSVVALYPCVVVGMSATLKEPSLSKWLPLASLAAACLVTGGAATWSRRIYCRADQDRHAAAPAEGNRSVQRGWLVLLWLTWRQARGFALGMTLFGVFSAVAVALIGLTAWPFLSLLAGILCGITAFADEQQSGSFRFAGEQRYPLGRIWLVKASVRLALGLGFVVVSAVGVAVLIAVRATVAPRENVREFELQIVQGRLFGFSSQPFLSLSLWLGYGYAVAMFFGLLFRKPLVAGVVAVGVAGPLTALWLPSQVNGGLHAWQAFGVPLLMLGATRVLMRPWTSDRLLSAPVCAVAAGVVVASALWLGGSFLYRAVEIASAAQPVDVETFRASLPPPEKNTGGRSAAQGLRRLGEIQSRFSEAQSNQSTFVPVPGQERAPAGLSFLSSRSMAAGVAERGWSGNKALAAWLDAMFADPWAKPLAVAAGEPTGVALDPREITGSSLLPEEQAAPTAAILLAARGLQKQADGDPALFVEHLRMGLSLARNLRHKTVRNAVSAGRTVEETMLRSVELWLARLDGRADLLRQALDELVRHDQEPQPSAEDVRAAAFLVTLNSFDDAKTIVLPSRAQQFLFPASETEADLLRFSWQVPWEKERLRRALEQVPTLNLAIDFEKVLARAPVTAIAFGIFRSNDGLSSPNHSACLARGVLLQIALRLYEAETGGPAERLADLVPRYLRAVPEDPYDHGPFHYRLSQGETLRWPPDDLSTVPQAAAVGRPESALALKHIPQGQGIVWSAGSDGHDNGGHVQESPHFPGAISDADWIFVVPLPPGRR